MLDNDRNSKGTLQLLIIICELKQVVFPEGDKVRAAGGKGGGVEKASNDTTQQ